MIEPRNPFETADDGESELQEKVGILLEDAGIRTEVCDQIMKLIAAEEKRMEPVPCDVCGAMIDGRADACMHCG